MYTEDINEFVHRATAAADLVNGYLRALPYGYKDPDYVEEWGKRVTLGWYYNGKKRELELTPSSVQAYTQDIKENYTKLTESLPCNVIEEDLPEVIVDLIPVLEREDYRY